MKTNIKLLLAITCLIMLVSCSKDKEKLEIVSGDYEWVYAVNITASSGVDDKIITWEESNDRYGLTIEENGKLFFFKNGLEEGRYKISEFGNNSDGNYFIYKYKTTPFKNSYYYVYYTENSLLLNGLMDYSQSYFKKK